MFHQCQDWEDDEPEDDKLHPVVYVQLDYRKTLSTVKQIGRQLID